MDSREVSLIVHLLFNGDTGSFQTAPSARKCASIVFGKVGTIIKVSVFGKRTRLFQCKFCRHSLGKLGGVAVVRCKCVRARFKFLHIGAPKADASNAADFIMYATAASNFSVLQPLPFLFRQHISPRALFMQPRPCRRCGRTNELVTPSHLYHPLMGPVAQISQRKKATHTHVSRLSHFVIRPPFHRWHQRCQACTDTAHLSRPG